MKRTPLLFLLCVALLVFTLFHLDPSHAESESSSAVLVHETFSQHDDKLKPVAQKVESAKNTGVNFERQQLPQSATNPDQDQKPDIAVVASYQNDTSIRLRDMKPHPVLKTEHEANKNPKIPTRHKDSPDPVVQDRFDILKSMATPNMPSPILNFDGIPYPGVACNCAPPDPNGEVGATQYVQIANEGFQVFNKATGASQLGPVGISTVWSGFGGVCETAGSGDPVVLYDQLANRWVISQFAGTEVPTDECVAVSTTNDATGSYYRYAFHLGSNFFDYPKLAVWPDAYYMAMSVFDSSGTSYLGPQPFALDRARMLAGQPATFITTQITGGPNEALYLPADLDGSTLPPAGAPATFIEWPGTGTYRIFHFHVDFANPLNSSFTLFSSPPAAGFTQLCPSTRSCVPQSGATSRLDAMGDRLMFRLAYRNFGAYESVVGNYTVSSGSVAGIRWFELRNVTNGPVAVAQESTYQPDSTWRWMGSAAMDHDGNMAIGYSASSSTIFPELRYAGRLASDPVNTLGQGETTLFAGTGSQEGTFSRWGDYSAMTIDPVDDCTFWYTQEYYATTSSFNWRTRIASFKFPGCGGTSVTRTLTVGSSNPGSGVNITRPTDTGGLADGVTQFSRTYNNITNVSLTAPATAGGNNFHKWQRNGITWSFSQTTNVTMDANYTMTAVYAPASPPTLEVESANPFSGVNIATSPNDNNGQGDGITQFSRIYNNNTIVTLTAPVTAGGNGFFKWRRNGVDWSHSPTTSVTIVPGITTMTAIYIPTPRNLTVASTNPAGGVSITVSPNDQTGSGNGTTQFTRTYIDGTTVTLTAPATAGGNNFQKWQRNGVDWSTTQTTNLTMNANYTMTAVYVTPQRTLTVASTNPASGVSITVSPNDNDGLGNGTTQFSRTYNQNTSVSLTAPATAAGNNFQKWQRDGVDWATTQATTVTLDANHTMTAVYSAVQSVVWTNVVGVTASGNSLTKTAADNWGNAGAVSSQAIVSGDGYVEFTASETNRARMCGLGNGDSDQNYTDIEFAIQLTASDGTNGIWVFESGTFRGSFGTYTAGDKFRVAVEGGVVKYSKNGTVFYTSTVAPNYPLLVDTSLYSNGSTLTNVIILGNLSGGG